MIWGLILATPVGVCSFLALIGIVTWVLPVAALLLCFAAAYVLFPYVTKLDVAVENPNEVPI